MSLYQDWVQAYEELTSETVQDFWNRYADAEKRIYTTILSDPDTPFSGTIQTKTEELDVDPVLFMGFLDGINDSLREPLDVESMEPGSSFRLDIDFEKLYYNMHKAEADHLYSIPEWENVLSEEQRGEIAKSYKRSKTVVKEIRIGRNDPCPCGSGKKYKKCCGRAV